MCEFLSWVELPNGKLRYLTAKNLATKKGRELREYVGNSEDLTGHGAIRKYWGLDNYIIHHVGKNHECADFSTPDNFPSELAEAIKSGEFRGLGLPLRMLVQEAQEEYDRVYQPARKEYIRVYQEAKEEYDRVYQEAR